MSNQLRRHLIEIGVPSRRRRSGTEIVLQVALWSSIGLIGAAQFLSVNGGLYTGATFTAEFLLALNAGSLMGLRLSLRRLAQGRSERERIRYVRLLFLTTRAMFFAPLPRLLIEVAQVLIVTAVLLAADMYIAMVFLIVMLYAGDRLFEEHADFVSYYAERVEQSPRRRPTR